MSGGSLLIDPSTGRPLRVVKDTVRVLNNKLHGQVLGMHVSHLALDAQISHDGRCKDDSQVLGRHLEERLVRCSLSPSGA